MLSWRAFFPFLILASACARYHNHIAAVRDYYEQGRHAEAIALMDRVTPKKRDRLLYFLDKGTILHAAGDYERSVHNFADAIDLTEISNRRHAGEEVGAVLTSDHLLTYAGEPFEHLLMHLFQILNYAALGQMEEARVEVRRIETRFPDICAKPGHYLCDAFHRYLAGIIWEGNQNYNDAHIDYKHILPLHYKPRTLTDDLRRTAQLSGLPFDPAQRPAAPPELERSPGHGATLVVVVESGRVPLKESSEYQHDFQILPVPVYHERDQGPRAAAISLNGKASGFADVLTDVGALAEKSLADEMPAIISRALGRLLLKEGAAVAVGTEIDPDLGVLVGLMMFATNRADLRSWSTLPHYFQIWRRELPAGDYEVGVGGSSRRTVSLTPGATIILTYRIF